MGEPVRFRVERQDYSRGAWRVLHKNGQQVYAQKIFDHPMLGPVPLVGPVCFDRKRDAVAWVNSHADNSAAVSDTPEEKP